MYTAIVTHIAFGYTNFSRKSVNADQLTNFPMLIRETIRGKLFGAHSCPKYIAKIHPKDISNYFRGKLRITFLGFCQMPSLVSYL